MKVCKDGGRCGYISSQRTDASLLSMEVDPVTPLNGQTVAPAVQESQKHLLDGSSTTQAEILHGNQDGAVEPPHKKARTGTSDGPSDKSVDDRDRRKGTAPVKAEYLLESYAADANTNSHVIDDDAAESKRDSRDDRDKGKGKGKRGKSKGQNKARDFGTSFEAKGLCSTRTYADECSAEECQFGDNCKFEHDLRKYLSEHKRADLETFDCKCPIWAKLGKCPVGFKCRFAGSHMKERELGDGRKELYLVIDETRAAGHDETGDGTGNINVVSNADKIELSRKRYPMPKSDKVIKWLDNSKGDSSKPSHTESDLKEDQRAEYIEPPLLASEKRKIYFGRDTPTLAPLTTQGNLPYRRLCVDLGAQFTYSEMAMSVPLVTGSRSEWALLKAHESEAKSPAFGASPYNIVQGYDNSKDFKFGAQISSNKPWSICKATEILTALCPHLRVIDLNCGCPIDLVYNTGAGSALLDSPPKLEKMLMSMNAVSGEIPITCKIRMGTKDKHPTALKLVNRLVNGANNEQGDKPDASTKTSGVAAITLHGRSRQQRYSRSADWSYISECASLIKRHHEETDASADTVREADARDQPAKKVFFLGNGDCYSHIDYYDHMDNAGVDSIMIGRGALVKPWLFEEIAANQYLDKSASERLTYIEQYCRYGLESWGSDEVGVGATRKFLLEWLSFAHRYVPIGLLEYLPPSLQDRPPRFKGRNELETLLASDNYLDWIKISEMFLGKAADTFKFQPKHKSNS